jgi:hypothetical protein
VQYVSAGSHKDLIGVNDCAWMCTAGFFLRFSTVLNTYSCSACSTTFCPAGQYRETCTTNNRTVNAACLACTPPPPVQGYLTQSSEYNMNNCSVKCQKGWWFLSSRRKCCSDNAVILRSTRDCVCGAGFTSPSPDLNGIICNP